MKILGISAYYHDSAAALVIDGGIVAAAQEERFTRIKHDSSFPTQAIIYCLKEADISLSEIDRVVFYEKPFQKFERLLETYLAVAPRGFNSFRLAMPIWLKEKLFQKRLIRRELDAISSGVSRQLELLFCEHHQSHAASAFFPSPFDDAVILTMDGVGEWATASLSIGKGNSLEMQKEIHFPHSLGLLYSAITYYLGFRVNSGEYKVMGLAPYGEPKFSDLIYEHLIDLKPDGSFRLNMDYFSYVSGLTMTGKKMDRLFGGIQRQSEGELKQHHMDLAASVQLVTEEVVLKMAKSAAVEYGSRNLCLAGGVALNCVANGRLLKERVFDNLWIQPAAGDAGGALGAALLVHYNDAEQVRAPVGDAMAGAYLGPEYSDTDIESALNAVGANFEKLSENELVDEVAEALAAGDAVGWFQGRMEFGPRALGGRSILGDPRSPQMQKQLNLKVKFRESFRPFAPSVLREDVAEWFELDSDSPYMLLVAGVSPDKCVPMSDEEESLFGLDKLNIPRSLIPAVTHVDYSARIQTVHQHTNPKYHELLSAFKQKTGCPVLVNSSFNVRGEPIVCTPEDAYRCFMGTELDTLAIGNFLLRKNDQDSSLMNDYRDQFALD